MGEIDTTAPFACVRDAVYMFGEHSANTTQRVFPSNNTSQLQKINSLKEELHQLHEENVDVKNQLQKAEITTANTLRELVETKSVLEKENKRIEHMTSSKISLLESQDSQRIQEMNCCKEEMKKIYDELRSLKTQHVKTLDMLTKSQNENDKLCDDIVRETKAIAFKHEQYLMEKDNVAKEKMKKLLDELLVTKDFLAKANVAQKIVEKEFQDNEEFNLQRLKDSTITIDKLKIELQDAEDKQEEIILAVEKLKDALLTTKESEKKALQGEMDANLILKQMMIEVDDLKGAKEKVRMMAIQVEDLQAKLENATHEEHNLLASLASLRAQLNNSHNEVQSMKKEAKDRANGMEEQINYLQNDLSEAVIREIQLKNTSSNLNEVLQQVTMEVAEAKAVAIKASKDTLVKTQELEETLIHSQTLECCLQASIKELEVAKASEVFALIEVKFLKNKINNNIDINKNEEDLVTISYDEYETMAKKVTNSQNLASKRIAAALAQVDASKASEMEISKKLEIMKSLLERSQTAMKQAIKVAEAAEAAKGAVEGELRKWRSENEQRRKATVAAVMAVDASKKNSLIEIDDILFSQNGTIANEFTKVSSMDSPHALQSKESLAQFLRHSFSKDEKIKKKLFSTKISRYFNKKVDFKNLIK